MATVTRKSVEKAIKTATGLNVTVNKINGVFHFVGQDETAASIIKSIKNITVDVKNLYQMESDQWAETFKSRIPDTNKPATLVFDDEPVSNDPVPEAELPIKQGRIKRKGVHSKKPRQPKSTEKPAKRRKTIAELKIPDPEDREVLRGKSDNYIMGWNKVKHNSNR